MQKYREANPAWQDRVAVMTLSIDDTLEEARNHMTKRGWTNTFNARPAKATGNPLRRRRFA